MKKNILYVGLDVHKNTIDAAMAEGRDKSQVRSYGKINNTPDALELLSNVVYGIRRRSVFQ